MLNQGVSNAGMIVGDDHVMAIDSLGAPLESKAFLATILWGLPFFPPAEILLHLYCREAMLATPILSPPWEKRGGRRRAAENRTAVDDLQRQAHLLFRQHASGADVEWPGAHLGRRD